MTTYNRGPGRPSLKDIVDATLRMMLGTRCFTHINANIGTTKPKVDSGTVAYYCIDNVMYTKAATNDLFTHTDVTVQADLTTKYYLLCLDTSGNGSIVQGTATDLPAVPANKCPVGYLKIVTSGGTFTPGTTDHDNANVTVTYVNISQLPLTLS